MIEKIKQIVYHYFNVTEEEMNVNHKYRGREFVLVRQIVIYFLKKYTKMSLKSIGYIYDKDHSTVLHSIKTVKNLIVTDKAYKKDIEILGGDISKLLLTMPKSIKRRYNKDEMTKFVELCFDEETATMFLEFVNINEDIDLK